MRNIFWFLLVILIANSCNYKQKASHKLDRIFNTRYEWKLIPRGDNFPDFYPGKDSIDLYLVALHEKINIRIH